MNVTGNPALHPDGSTVYVGDEEGGLLALDSMSGKVLWAVAAFGAIRGKRKRFTHLPTHPPIEKRAFLFFLPMKTLFFQSSHPSTHPPTHLPIQARLWCPLMDARSWLHRLTEWCTACLRWKVGYPPTHPPIESPVAHSNRLVWFSSIFSTTHLPTFSFIHTGTLLWSFKFGKGPLAGELSPIITNAGDFAVVVGGKGTFSSSSSSSSSSSTTHPPTHPPKAHSSSFKPPASPLPPPSTNVAHTHLFLLFLLLLGEVYGLDALDGNLIWNTTVPGGPVIMTPTLGKR